MEPVEKEAVQAALGDDVRTLKNQIEAVKTPIAQRRFFKERFGKFGIDLDDVERALSVDHGFANITHSSNKLFNTLIALEREDAGLMIDDVLELAKRFDQGVSGKVADYFGAIPNLANAHASLGPWALLGLANLFGASSLLLAINVAHDAAHHALTALSSAQLGDPDCGLHAARRKCLFVAIAARQIAP